MICAIHRTKMVVGKARFAKPWNIGMTYQCPTCEKEKTRVEVHERICTFCEISFGCKLHLGYECRFVKTCGQCSLFETNACHVTLRVASGGSTSKTHGICPTCLKEKGEEIEKS